MLELHGWVVIRDTPDYEDKLMKEIIEKIVRELRTYDLDEEHMILKVMNGEYFININAVSNRETQEISDIKRIFEYIGRISTGSYGIMYLRNDEDINGKNNEFEVYILSRGNVRIEQDNFLSPCVPIIEDLIEWFIL